MATPKITPLAERFARFIDPADASACWPWKGSMNGKYGQICSGEHQQSMLAHRASWIIANGPIPDGLQVLHRCDDGRCVNPSHLFLGTQLDNIRDMMTKGRDALRGEKHYGSKLTDEIVREIRRSPDTGRMLAKRFGVPFQTISDARRRKSWKHVD